MHLRNGLAAPNQVLQTKYGDPCKCYRRVARSGTHLIIHGRFWRSATLALPAAPGTIDEFEADCSVGPALSLLMPSPFLVWNSFDFGRWCPSRPPRSVAWLFNFKVTVRAIVSPDQHLTTASSSELNHYIPSWAPVMIHLRMAPIFISVERKQLSKNYYVDSASGMHFWNLYCSKPHSCRGVDDSRVDRISDAREGYSGLIRGIT